MSNEQIVLENNLAKAFYVMCAGASKCSSELEHLEAEQSVRLFFAKYPRKPALREELVKLRLYK